MFLCSKGLAESLSAQPIQLQHTHLEQGYLCVCQNFNCLCAALHSSIWQHLCAKVSVCLAHLDHWQKQQPHSSHQGCRQGCPTELLHVAQLLGALLVAAKQHFAC